VDGSNREGAKTEAGANSAGGEGNAPSRAPYGRPRVEDG
jgi:hypothetical protein